MARIQITWNSHSLWEYKLAVSLKNSLAVFCNNKHTLSIWPSSLTPTYLPKRMKMYVHTKTCTWMFMAVLLIVASQWKQSRCPSIGEWVNKLQYLHAMEYYSTIKSNELLIYKQHKWISVALFWLKEIIPIRLHILWYHLNGIWKRQDYSGCQGLSWRGGTDYKKIARRNFGGWSNCSVLFCGCSYKTMHFWILVDINLKINGKKIPECWQGEILGVTRNNKAGVF